MIVNSIIGSGSGNVTANSNIADNNMIIGDGGSTNIKGVDGIYIVNFTYVLQKTESIDNEEIITLPNAIQGMLEVFGGNEFMYVNVLADGQLISISASANTDLADTESNLCIYSSGAQVYIKNRLGITYNITYTLRYQ